jgi:hypothetical protein
MAIKKTDIIALNGTLVTVERITGKVNTGTLQYTKGSDTVTTKPQRGRSAVISLDEIKSIGAAESSNGHIATVKVREKPAVVSSVTARKVTAAAAAINDTPFHRCVFTGEVVTPETGVYLEVDGKDYYYLKSQILPILQVLIPSDDDDNDDVEEESVPAMKIVPKRKVRAK